VPLGGQRERGPHPVDVLQRAGQARNGEYMRFRELNGTVTVTQATPTTSAINTEVDDANGFNDPTKIIISGGVSFSQPSCPTPP
jgi:hypothetical protein